MTKQDDESGHDKTCGIARTVDDEPRTAPLSQQALGSSSGSKTHGSFPHGHKHMHTSLSDQDETIARRSREIEDGQKHMCPDSQHDGMVA